MPSTVEERSTSILSQPKGVSMRSRSFAMLIGLIVSFSTAASADCQSEEAQIQRLITQAAEQMSGNDSICYAARDAERVFREVLRFYERCPINDPGGQMRQSSRETIDWARQMQASACAR
jgi:hypothetical protein